MTTPQRVTFEDGSSAVVVFDAQGKWHQVNPPNRGGGYRPPANPAPASGPGALSRRTDGGQPMRALPDAKYGENKAFEAQQRGAPLSKTGEMPPGRPAARPSGEPDSEFAQLPPITGFNAPSSRPEEPLTAGAAMGPGPGPGPEVHTLQQGQLSRALAPYFAEDDTGYIRLIAEDLAEWGL